jgi:hypothetical protein
MQTGTHELWVTPPNKLMFTATERKTSEVFTKR